MQSLAISRGIVESPVVNHPLVEKLRSCLTTIGTDGSGFNDLQRRFNVIDRDGSKTLFLEEFKIAFQRCNLDFSDQEITTLFYLFDVYDKNYLDYDEFMINIRGPVGERRRMLIDKAFQLLDFEGRGTIYPEDLIDRYDSTNHPDVKTGVRKSQDVFRDFLRSFDVSSEIEGMITHGEFENYYLNMSASIERDEYFEQAICNAWRMSSDLANWEGVTSNNNPESNTWNRSRNGGSTESRPRTLEEICVDKEKLVDSQYQRSNDDQSRQRNFTVKGRYMYSPRSRGRSMSPGRALRRDNQVDRSESRPDRDVRV